MSQRQIEALVARFIGWGFDERGWSQKTRRTYGYRVRAADMWMQIHYRRSLLFATPRQLKAYLFDTPANALNRNNIRQALVAFFDFAVSENLRDDNPASALPRLKQPKPLPRALHPDQAERLLRAAKALGPMIECMVSVLAYEGLRRNEVRLMRWHQLDLDHGEMRFIGKGTRHRALPLHPHTWDRLAYWKQRSDEAEWVFPSPRHQGRPISESHMRTLVFDVGDLAGVLGLTPHVLRHTFATTLLDRGVNLRTVQELMGHASLATTERYLKVRDHRLKEAIDSLSFSDEGKGGEG